MQTFSVLLAALALTGQNAAADPYADVNAMRVAFTHVRSVVAVERFDTGETATVKYAAPNRFHITMPRSEIVLAGDVEYSRRAGATWQRSSEGPEHQVLLMAAWQLAGPPELDIHKLFTITSLGTESVAGCLQRKPLDRRGQPSGGGSRRISRANHLDPLYERQRASPDCYAVGVVTSG